MTNIEIARVFVTQKVKTVYKTSDNKLFYTENDGVNYAKDQKLEDDTITPLHKADYATEIEEVKLEIELAKEPVLPASPLPEPEGSPLPEPEPENPPV
jgi:hypothetical protein